MNRAPATARELVALLTDLDRRGIELPDRVTRSVLLVASLDPVAITARPQLGDVLAATPADLVDHIRTSVLLVATEDRLREHAAQLADQIMQAAAAELRDDLDQVLDQLRPDFTTAAAQVHQAVQAGIRPGGRAEQVILLDDQAVTAWRNLPTPMAPSATLRVCGSG